MILSTKITQSRFSIALTQPPKVLSVSHDIDILLGFQEVDFFNGHVCLQDRIHAQDQDIAKILFSNETQPAIGSFNIRLRHADGRIRCIKAEYTKTLDHAGVVILDLLLIDAKSLWLNQGDQTVMANFAAMMDNTDDYIYFKDRNHVFTGASQTLVAITEPSEHWKDLIGKTDYDVFPEEYADIYYSLEKQVFAGTHVAHEEQETLDNQGNKGWVDNRKYPIKNANGEVVGLFGIARDISENKRIAELLARSETKYHTLFDSTGDAIMMLDEKGFFDCNQAALTLFGLHSLEELRQYSPADLSPTAQPCGTNSKQLAEKYINTAFQKGSVNFEWTHQRADSKKTFIAEILLTSLSLDGKSVLQTTVRDITERKQAEFETKLIIERSQHLLKLESFSEQLTEKEFMQHGQELAENLTGSQIAFIHFVNNDEETIELVAWSRRTVEHYCHATFDSHYPVSKAGIWADALRNKQPVVFNDYATYPHKRGLPEGHSPLQRLISVPVIENGKVVMLTGVGNKETDYTETDVESVQLISNDIWRLVQRRRTERDQIIAATVFESQEGMMVTDANSNILRVNHAFTKITGYSAEEAIGQTPSLLKSGQHDDAFFTSMWEKINREGYWEGKIWNKRKNGEVYPEQLTITSIKNASGIVTNYVATLIDFSRQQQVEGALKDSEERFRTMFEQAPLGVALIDSFTGHIYNVNTKFASITGRSLTEMSNIDWMSITHPDDVQEDLDNMAQLNAMTIPGFSMNKRYILPDGSYVWINMTIAPLKEKDGTHKQHLCMIEDISERKQLELELTKQAHLDYLTGLSNRRHFMAQGEVELSRAKRYNTPLSVLMLDIDFFKNVNDTYGHQVGDIVLQELAKVCQSTLRQVDIAGRLGGEEFAIILPEADAKEAFEVAERLREIISKTEVNKPDGLPIHFTVSMGVATLEDKNVNIDTLLNQADKALYKAKETGRNKVCVG